MARRWGRLRELGRAGVEVLAAAVAAAAAARPDAAAAEDGARCRLPPDAPLPRPRKAKRRARRGARRYSDYVLKNPFQDVEQPIQEGKFKRKVTDLFDSFHKTGTAQNAKHLYHTRMR